MGAILPKKNLVNNFMNCVKNKENQRNLDVEICCEELKTYRLIMSNNKKIEMLCLKLYKVIHLFWHRRKTCLSRDSDKPC